jgi:hypothetical protein
VTSRDFCFWLQGVFEIGGIKSLDVRQAEIVRNHLDMVFAHEIDPSAGTPEHQAELSSLHEGQSKHEVPVSPFVGPDLNNILVRC